MVRAKLKLIEISSHHWHPTGKTLKFNAEYDPSIPEDQRFAQATPSASIVMYVDNPNALGQFELGHAYYVDFTAVPPQG